MQNKRMNYGVEYNKFYYIGPNFFFLIPSGSIVLYLFVPKEIDNFDINLERRTLFLCTFRFSAFPLFFAHSSCNCNNSGNFQCHSHKTSQSLSFGISMCNIKEALRLPIRPRTEIGQVLDINGHNGPLNMYIKKSGEF